MTTEVTEISNNRQCDKHSKKLENRTTQDVDIYSHNNNFNNTILIHSNNKQYTVRYFDQKIHRSNTAI